MSLVEGNAPADCWGINFGTRSRTRSYLPAGQVPHTRLGVWWAAPPSVLAQDPSCPQAWLNKVGDVLESERCRLLVTRSIATRPLG